MPAISPIRNLRKLIPTCLVAGILVMMFCVFSLATDTKAEVRQRFENKIFLIKGWYQDSDLKYDSSGVVRGTPVRGAWTASAVKIRSIKIRHKDIVLRGIRGGLAYDEKTKKFDTIITKDLEVTITIGAEPAALTPASLDTLESAIFTQSAKVDDLPEYWRDFMVHGEQDTKKDARGPNAEAEAVPGLQSNGEPVFRVGRGITPPRAIRHSDPEFTEIARQVRYQGTLVLSSVIDDQGVPTQIQIKRALGMGFDDAAVSTVEQWRFHPAQRADKAVPVLVDIEVSFKLY